MHASEKMLKTISKHHTQEKVPFLYLFIYFHKLSQRLKMQDPETRCVTLRPPLQRVLLRYFTFQLSPPTDPILFDKCNHFNNRAIQIHFIYSQALPRASLLDCLKDLSAGDSSSVVVEGQSNRLQANPFQPPILQSSQCIQDPGAPTEVWVGLGQRQHKGETEK